MAHYLARRVLTLVPVLVLITIISFSVVQVLPGNVALAMLGEERARDADAYARLSERLGLDRPLAVRYVSWVTNAVKGDLGRSYRTGEPVAAALWRRLGPTLQLTFLSLVIAVAIGLPLGVLSAVRPNGALDLTGTIVALSGVSIPNFWLGILLIYTFSVHLRVLPSSGYVSILEDPIASLRLMIMPAIALGTALAAVVLRQTRSAILDVLGEDYIRTARSKGLTERSVLRRHALRNALIPVITVIGMQIGRLFGGAVTIEIVFSIPGMGRLAVDSIGFRDFEMLQGVILVMAVAVLVVNLITDLAYASLDPRIQYD